MMSVSFYSTSIQRILVIVAMIFLTLGMSPESSSQVDAFAFDTIEQQQRFRQLSDELRCPMCQNTNLTGSTGGVAEDLRREVYRMIMDGRTNAEIEQFMFERYGDFIFYRPRLRAETILLWFGPLVFLIIGAMVAYGITRRAKVVNSASSSFLDADQQARLKEILDSKQ